MKFSFRHILFIGGVLLTPVCVSFAQESSYPVMENMEDHRERTFEEPYEDSKFNQKTSIPKDSSTSKPTYRAKPDSKSPEKQDQEESVLYFNFLYYIIQKVKKSDILGE